MVETIDDIQIHFNSDNLWVVNLTLSLVMFGVALDIKISDFTNLLKSPKPVIVGIISQFILIPLVTFLMISLAALIMTPLNFAIWGSFYEPTSEILKSVKVSPMEVARFVLLILGIPLVIGMVINNYHPNFASKASRLLKPISILIFLAFIAGAFYNNLDIFLTHIHYVFVLVIAHNTILLLVGFYFAKANKLTYLDQKTLSIETGIQNSGLGLLLVFSFFDGLGGMALLVAFWAIWDILSGLLIAFFWSDKKKKKAS